MTSDDIVEKVKNYHIQSSGRINRSVIFELCNPVMFEYKEVEIDPYIVGALIGDGCFGASSANITLTNPEYDIIERIGKRLPETCIIKPSCNDGVHYHITDTERILKNGKKKRKIRLYFEEIGLWRCLSLDKHIPDCYKFSDVNQRTELMRGLVDTDGEISRSSYVYSTISKQLAIDVKFVVESLGGKCSIQYYKRKNSKYNNFYILHFRISPDIVLYSSDKHKSHFKDAHYDVSRHIVNFETEEIQNCTKVILSGEDHSVLTNNFIPIEVK